MVTFTFAGLQMEKEEERRQFQARRRMQHSGAVGVLIVVIVIVSIAAIRRSRRITCQHGARPLSNARLLSSILAVSMHSWLGVIDRVLGTGQYLDTSGILSRECVACPYGM